MRCRSPASTPGTSHPNERCSRRGSTTTAPPSTRSATVSPCERLRERARASVDDVAARPRPPHGRGRAQLVPAGARAARTPRRATTRTTTRRRLRRSRRRRPEEAFATWRAEIEHARAVDGGRGVTRPRSAGAAPGRRRLAALDPRPHDRGVRPPQRPRRPPPRADRRRHRRLRGRSVAGRRQTLPQFFAALMQSRTRLRSVVWFHVFQKSPWPL